MTRAAACLVTSLLVGTTCPIGAFAFARDAAGSLGTVRSGYLEGCGGCHGVNGRSFAPRVPDLAREVGFFLCTPEGRDFILRLPNVAFSAMDSEHLAGVMNFVAFGLGDGSAPMDAPPFTPGEIEVARRHPFTDTALATRRTRVLSGILQRCPAAAGLGAYGAPASPSPPLR